MPGALLAAVACATTTVVPPPRTPAQGERPGVRLLYAARVEGPDGPRPGVRLAAAVAPPDRLRLEVLGPAGGSRLVLATEGTRAVALALHGKQFDIAPATPETFAAWTGLPVGPAALVALLSGRAPCPPAGTADGAPSPADPCPDLRFVPAGAGPDAEECSGRLEDRHGRLLATIACTGGGAEGWPERIRIDLPEERRSLELRRTDGPRKALLDETLFAPEVPEGFARADLLGANGAGPLFDSDPARTP